MRLARSDAPSQRRRTQGRSARTSARAGSGAAARGSTRARLVRRAAALAALAGVSTGCYTYVPRDSGIEPGQRVALNINDAGRVALAGGLGAGAERVEGDVLSQTDSALSVRVTAVRYRGGTSARWSGEPVEVRRSHVHETRERRFSRARTLALAATLVAAVATLVLTTDFDAFGLPRGGDDGPGGGPDQ